MSQQIPLDESNLVHYLRRLGLVGPGERLLVEKAGDGNINWVRRARAEGSPRSWVVKQARPALERFPEYSASTERIAFEARYYEVTAPLDPDSACPSVLWFDPIQCVLVLEDLGDAERLDGALGRGADARAWAETIGRFLGAVHSATGRDDGAALAPRFRKPARLAKVPRLRPGGRGIGSSWCSPARRPVRCP